MTVQAIEMLTQIDLCKRNSSTLRSGQGCIANVWNSLPGHITEAETHRFKSRLAQCRIPSRAGTWHGPVPDDVLAQKVCTEDHDQVIS